MIDTKQIKNAIERVMYNPSAIQRIMVDAVEEATNGTHTVLDPTSPFAMLLEASSATAASTMSSHASKISSLYARQAESIEDLYKHMSDKDYVDRFSVPSRTNVQLRISIDELLQEAVQIGNTAIRMVTIPADTVFQMNTVKFGIYYPIDIRVMPHGGIHVNWDRSVENPLRAVSGNVLETERWRGSTGIEYLLIDIPVEQMTQTVSYHSVSYSTGLRTTIAHPDSFYAARVYHKVNNEWVEILTTHTDQVHDRRKPTVVLQAHDEFISLNVPQIYINERTIGESLRVDIFSTRGELDMSLDNYTSEAWGANWLDLHGADSNPHVVGLRNIVTMALSSDSVTVGGRNGLTFEQLRERTIYTSVTEGYTFNDLVFRTKNLGYDLSLQYDNITDRRFLATRELPGPVGTDSVSTAGVTVSAFDFTMDEITSYPTVNTKVRTVTILPRTLFDNSGERLAVSDNDILMNPKNHTSEAIATALNTGNFVYTPFHYVMDIQDDSFTSRCYYLESPEIVEREFLQTNETYPLDVSVGRLEYILTDKGYRLIVMLKSGPSVKLLTHDQVHVQLAFTPKTSGKRAYLNGTLHRVDGEPVLVEDERVYIFDLETEYEIDKDDDIFLTNFRMFPVDNTDYALPLTESMEIYISVSNYTQPGTVPSSIDGLIGKEFLPDGAVGITHERVKLKMGDRLTHIEGKTLTFLGEDEYEKYPADVPAINTVPQFETNSDGLLVVSLVNDEIEYNTIAAVGEQTVDSNGDPVWLHRKDDVVMENGKPKVKDIGSRTRRSDMVLIDAKYRYTTEVAMRDYAESLPKTMVEYVTEDIDAISKTLAPRTSLRFVPKTNTGDVDITVTDNTVQSAPANLSFRVELYLTSTAYDNSALRDELTRVVNSAISAGISERTISTYDISERIDELTDASVVGIHVQPITDQKLNVFTVVREDTGFSVGSRMIVLSNSTLKIVDDIAVTFHRHTA